MNSIFRYEERNGEIMITGLREGVTETSIVIPDTIGELPVTEIKRVAFYESSITDIKIGKNIKEIGPDAFSYSKSLKAVHWNTQAKNIPRCCFFNCTSLSKFDFSSVESIDESAFSGSGLKEVDLPHNIQKVRKDAFCDCQSLKAVRWNAQTKSIPMDCFHRCSSLSEFDFSRVESIDESAFSESGLKEVVLPHNIQKVRKDAFYGCKSLKAVRWNAQTKSIPMDCFRRCSSLSEFDFSSVEKIGAGAFEQSGLKVVNLSHSLQIVEGNAFYGCKSLKAVHWNAQAKNIPLRCFYECSSLKQFSFSDVEYLAVEAFAHSGLTSVKLSKGTEVGQSCFAYCNDLKKIEWLSDISIKGRVFEGCKNIKEIFISDKVMNIAVDAFASSPNAEITFV